MSVKPLIFCVDDEPDNLELLARALHGHYVVRTFRDPREALAAVKKEEPVALVVDQRMPSMTGLALLRELRAAGGRAAAIVVTAYPGRSRAPSAKGWPSAPSPSRGAPSGCGRCSRWRSRTGTSENAARPDRHSPAEEAEQHERRTVARPREDHRVGAGKPGRPASDVIHAARS
jgi:CheY-like chemotaxis protein